VYTRFVKRPDVVSGFCCSLFVANNSIPIEPIIFFVMILFIFVQHLSDSKIASMIESKDFRKGIIQLEWLVGISLTKST